MEYIAYVSVSIPIGIAFDGKPKKAEKRRAALENFLDHPALESADDLEHYIDEISYEKTPDNGQSCEACGGEGWILANNDVHGLRIERCDTCGQFDSDSAAVTRVASRAKGGR
jgi:hypothetical protein